MGVPAGQMPFVPVGSELGFQELSPWHVAQDSTGLIWFSSDQGVYLYDGRHVRHFGVAEGLPALFSTALVVGRGDRVWCATQRGLALYEGGRWHAAAERHPGLGLERVGETLGVDPQGRLWASTPRGLVRERDDGGFELDAHWPDVAIESLFVDASGATLVGALGAIYVRESGDGPFRRLGAEAGVPAARIIAAMRDGSGRVWGATVNGVVLLRPGAERFEPWGAFRGAWTRMHVDREGRPWLASEVGLFYPDEANGVRRADRLPTPRVVGAFEDREGSLWVTGHGLFRQAGRGLWQGYFERDGLPDAAIWSVRRAPDGRLWAGTQRGLAYATAAGWERPAEVPAEQIRGITPGPSGELWLNGPEAHVYRYDPIRRQVEAFGPEHGLPEARTFSLALDAGGAVWVGTDAGAFVSEGGGGARRFAAQTFGLEGGVGRVRDLQADGRGRLWATSERGLLVREGGAWRRLTTADGLRMDMTSYVVARAGGEVCVAYTLDVGLSCFRYEGGAVASLAHFDARGGLGSDIVYFLGEDARGRLWVGTNAGADVIAGGRVEHFGVLDGLPHHDCDGRAFWAEPGGEVWVGTSAGLGRFEGARHGGPPAPPAATLRGRREGEGGAMVPLAAGAALPYERRAVEFRFSALSFLHEPAMEFETRLVGAGAEAPWRPAPDDRTRYAALAARAYEFQVRARHPGGAWGRPESLRFVVLPPWWQTDWFHAAAASALLAAVALTVRWRSAALGRRNRELELQVAERTRELTEAHAEIARSEKLSALGRVLAQLSHELNNPVNVVWNNVGPLREYVATMGATLVAFRDGARALPDGGEAFEARWREADLDYIVQDASAALAVVATAAARVRDVQADLGAFLRGGSAEKQRRDLNEDLRATVQMVARALPRGVRLEATYGAVGPVEYEPGRMNQVFLNLLQNAIHAVGDAGRVTVRTWTEGGAAKVEVADDGPGVAAEIRERIFEPFFTTKAVGKGTGLGLSICRQIVVEQHGGALAVDAARARGAAFVVALPAGAGAGAAGPDAPAGAAGGPGGAGVEA